VCDNQALLKAVKRWVGEGGKATLVGAPDADIVLEAIKELRQRTTAGAATFRVKVKAHRGEPANEGIKVVTGEPRNAKTKAASSGWFELDPSSLRPTFLCCLFLFPRRFTQPAPISPPDDDCFYYHSWRNNVIIAPGTLSSFLS